VTRDRLLFYCQHSLGLGHLARSLRLADGLTDRFDVRLLNGGRFPAGTAVPAGVDVLNLPPLGHDADGMLVSHIFYDIGVQDLGLAGDWVASPVEDVQLQSGSGSVARHASIIPLGHERGATLDEFHTCLGTAKYWSPAARALSAARWYGR